ncbi:MAG TPA: nickel-responsive transcriptional regulator NikR [Caldithrix abyssi]|uniref:Putative nickel-responsive regulator n=1 Tax=Caldithrix abyssi TaxID=187145 RepID=A0A7V5UE45_CALAY|nr:nickel-responsive transcriptional regulator NikR [Caldithrix abyssi]
MVRNKLVRFSISLPEDLIHKFDDLIRRKQYSNRSEAVRDLIRRELIAEQIEKDQSVLGVLHLLYDHHKHDLSDKLADIQHHAYEMIISTTHVHVDHDNCLEVVLLKGQASRIRELSDKMIACAGVKSGKLYLTSQGKGLN